jgi:hypothetical protein
LGQAASKNSDIQNFFANFGWTSDGQDSRLLLDVAARSSKREQLSAQVVTAAA